MRYRSSLQVMIFVIEISCLSRGPDDQGLSCGPENSSSSGKGLSDGGLVRLKSGDRGEGITSAQCCGHRREGEQGGLGASKRLDSRQEGRIPIPRMRRRREAKPGGLGYNRNLKA